jgi:sulfatase maturation enzyme AslB (radical SAM superfamily)
MSNWRCPAIERGVTIYDDGVIRPCCVIDWSYSKPISEINNPNRFSDLGAQPSVCKKCIDSEQAGIGSRRLYQLHLEKQKLNNRTSIQYIDIRNTNLCNARCKFCGPHHTNQWPGAVLRHQSIEQYFDLLFTDDLIEIYFAGGEPLISKDHATILKLLVDRGLSKTVNLRYSSNLSVLKYKDIDFIELWKQYKSVLIMPSADGIGQTYEYIRQGLDWQTFESNVQLLQNKNISIQILFVLCSLNIWKFKETVDYFRNNNLNFDIELLKGPDEYKISTVLDKNRAEQEIRSCNLSTAQTEYFVKKLYE